MGIHHIAECIRQDCEYEKEPCFPIISFLEKVMDRHISGFEFRIGGKKEMGDNEGLASPDGSYIKLRQDVYEKAIDGDGRSRFTAAHELGHYILHTGIGFARQVAGRRIPPFRSAEAQANRFAAELLMPRSFITVGCSVSDIARRHNVTISAAKIRKECLLNGK